MRTIPSESRLRVLVVDDDADTTTSLSILLGLWGHEARVVADGQTALAVAAEVAPDVILLDLGLPGMSGWEVARRLQSVEGAKRPFIVAITGFGDENARAFSRHVGVDLHLTKPVEINQLASLLNRLSQVMA